LSKPGEVFWLSTGYTLSITQRQASEKHESGGEASMITEPKLEDRNAQHYVGIRSQVTMQELPAAMDQLGEVFAWLESKGGVPTGAPFIRYLVIDMEAVLEIDVAVPVANALTGEGRLIADTLPAGRYVTLLYTGDYSNLIGVVAELLAWAENKGLVFDKWSAGPRGEGWRARVETYLTNPAEEPDPEKWQTELAFLLAV
jgi:effector-binding domain-containing protein